MSKSQHQAKPLGGPPLARPLLVAFTLLFVIVFLVLPLAVVVTGALAQGPGTFIERLATSDMLAAMKLTALVTCLSVPLNVVFGVAAAILVTRFRFRGRSLLVTAIDLPFSVSPVISGMIFVLVFGRQGWFGEWLANHGLRVIFAVPGLVLATTFITFPFVARELMPLMETLGQEEETAATVLGATPLQTFIRVTLPNIKWALLHGTILASARAIGEFGAVSVVSGHIRGETNTVPLHVEVLYNEYDFVGAFAAATVLALVAVLTLGAKTWVESRSVHARTAAADQSP